MTGLRDRLASRRLRQAIAAVLWVAALGLVVDASLIGSPVAGAVSDLDHWVLLVVGGVLAVGAAGWRWWTTRDRSAAGADEHDTDTTLPQAITADTTPLVGGAFDATLTRALTDPDEVATLRTDLRELAIDALARNGTSRAAAEQAVTDGTWTDDARAAAFLADDAQPPLGLRVQDWFASEHSTRRQVRHTLDAIEEVLA